MRVLITGKQGQLVRSLMDVQERGYEDLELVCVGRPHVDLSEPGSMARLIAEIRPDFVVNAAAYTEVDRAEREQKLAFRINAEAAGEAAEAAAKLGSPIMQISTDYVFNGKSCRPWREDDPILPLNSYGKSKAAGEEMVRKANPKHLIIRTSWVVSPFGRNFIKTIVNAARDRDALSVVEDQRGRPTCALDLADAILMIIERWRSDDALELGRTYHVAGSGETSWYGLGSLVMEECRRLGAPSARVLPISSSQWPTPALRPSYSVLDCGRFETDFAQPLPRWQDATRKIVQRLLATDEPITCS